MPALKISMLTLVFVLRPMATVIMSMESQTKAFCIAVRPMLFLMAICVVALVAARVVFPRERKTERHEEVQAEIPVDEDPGREGENE